MSLSTRSRGTIIARAVILLADLIALVFLIVAVILGDYYYTDGTGPATDAIPFTYVAFSILWTFIALMLNLRLVNYHPGVDIGLEFLSWGILAGVVWLPIWWRAAYNGYIGASCMYPSRGNCSSTAAATANASGFVAVVMMLMAGCLHIFLFVKACRATHVRRIAARCDRVSFQEHQESRAASAHSASDSEKDAESVATKSQ